MSPEETRDQVVRVVGSLAMRHRAPSVVDGKPAPVMAEGTAPVSVVAHQAPVNPPRRRPWPHVVGAAVVALVGTIGYASYSAHARRVAHEERYPVVATAADEVVLEREADRWTAGRERLLANLAGFRAPPVDTMSGIGACTLPAIAPRSSEHGDASDPDAAISTHLMVLPGESVSGLDAVARPELDAMITAARRGRFQTSEARDHVIAAITGALIVTRLDEQRVPTTTTPGMARGTAYAFDPATGALRCAGVFTTTIAPTSGPSRDPIRDLSDYTERAILASLRAVDRVM